MEDEQNRQSPNPQATHLNEPSRTRLIAYIQRKLNERAAKKEQETTQDRLARRTASATVWIAMFTVVLAGAAILTLRQVIAGGSDTHDLAVAAKSQAEKMKDMSEAAEKIRQAADGMVTQEERIANNAKTALEASSKQSKVALDATIESARQDRRPWVGLRDFRCDDCTSKFNGPKPDQSFNRIETLKIGNMFGVMENTGKTPAVQMVVHAVWTNRKGSDPIPEYDTLAQRLEAAYQVPSHVPPDMASEIGKTLELIKRYRGEAPMVLPPNAVRILPMVSSFQMERNPMVRIEEENIAYIVGKITYYDTDRDREYVTTFCLMNETGNEFRFCPTGNDMK